MLGNKRAFFTGLLIAPILCLGLLGGLGAALSQPAAPAKDSLANYLQPADSPQVNITVPSANPVCQSRSMDIVAHEDDDILFMNPDITSGLNQGGCVQTVYMTAGDAGQGSTYWTGREHGAEAAYSSMLKQSMDWQENTVSINGQWQVTMATLRQAPNVSLIFVRLPDGNLFGDGFASTNFESLQKLEAGQIDRMQTVDGQASYSLNELTSLLSGLINQYQPDQIRTQADDSPDHSDHIAVSRLVSRAYQQFGANNIAVKPMSLNFYQGYPISAQPDNLSAGELVQKQDVFLEYARFDNAACNTIDQCNNASTYGFYLSKQYQTKS